MGSGARHPLYKILVVHFGGSATGANQQARKVATHKLEAIANDKIALSYYDQMTLLKERVLTTTSNWHSISYNDKRAGILALITRLCDILDS